MKVVNLIVLIMLLLNAALAAPGAHGPNGEHLTEEKPVQGAASGRQADGTVIVPMPQQRFLELKTALVRQSSDKVVAVLNGRVLPHPDAVALVQSSSNGRIERAPMGLPLPGQRVEAGQLLAYVRYQDTAYEQASQVAELIALRSEADTVQRELKRLQQLATLISEQQVEQLALRADSLKLQIRQLEQGLAQPEALYAPISGVVQPYQLTQGQWVEAGQTLFSIVDPTRLLVEALSADPALINSIDNVSVRELPQAKLRFIGALNQYQQGAVPLMFSIDSEQALPQMPVTLYIPHGEPVSGIRLPATAIVQNSQQQPQVWIKLSAERFIAQQVRYTMLSSNEVMVTKGLGADNRVVVQGASLLNQIR